MNVSWILFYVRRSYKAYESFNPSCQLSAGILLGKVASGRQIRRALFDCHVTLAVTLAVVVAVAVAVG